MKKTVVFLFVLVVALALLAGCEQLPSKPALNNATSFELKTVKVVPTAYLGDAYDLFDVILPEKDVEYSATACYVDIETKTDHPLEVVDMYFTPEKVQETVVTITATKGDEIATKIVYIPTSIHADPLDAAFCGGWSDPGFSKNVSIDPNFIKDGATSVHVSWNSVDPHIGGNTIFPLLSEATALYTDQTWENAIVTFWVYNPNDKYIEFQFRHCGEDFDTDFTDREGPQKLFALPGQWTQVFYSVRKGGTVGVPDRDKQYLGLKFRYEDYSTTEAYAFDFYVDGFDVVPAEMYPDVDTEYEGPLNLTFRDDE